MEAVQFFIENKSAFTVIHVLTVIVGMTCALSSDVLFSFYSKDKVISKIEARSLEKLSNLVWIVLIGIIFSGMALFLSDPVRYMNSDKFITKISIMFILLANGLFLSKFIFPKVTGRGFLKFKNKQAIRRLAFIGGAISVTSWFVVCMLGLTKSIPISVSQAMPVYAFLIIGAISIALFIEQKTFNK